MTQTWLHKAVPAYSRTRPKNTHGLSWLQCSQQRVSLKKSAQTQMIPGVTTTTPLSSTALQFKNPPWIFDWVDLFQTFQERVPFWSGTQRICTRMTTCLSVCCTTGKRNSALCSLAVPSCQRKGALSCAPGHVTGSCLGPVSAGGRGVC